MGSAKVPLFTMYNYDHSILDDIVLPEGIDKQLFINELLLSCGEFGVLYTDPAFMKFAVAHWANKWNHTFSEWLKGINSEYNPIHNYDRYEESSDTRTRNEMESANYDETKSGYQSDSQTINHTELTSSTGSDTETINTKDKRTADLEVAETKNLQNRTDYDTTDTSTQTQDGVVEHEVSAYDVSNYAPASKDTTNIGESTVEKTGHDVTAQTGTDTTATSGTDTTDHTGTDKHELTESGSNTLTGNDSSLRNSNDTLHVEGTLSSVTGNDSNLHQLHNYGNIGVTTAPQMLKEFYNISGWNLIDHMVELFKVEFLILTY